MSNGEIATVKDLVAALGGPAATITFFGERDGTIRQWLTRERLPARKYERHRSMLRDRGINASPALWNQESPPQ